MLYDIHHGKGAHVGCHIDEEIENHGCHALRCAAHEGEHEVTGLRDGRECHETLEVFLTNSEEVGNGDRSNDDPEKGSVPGFKETTVSGEYFREHCEKHKGCTSLRNHAQIARNDGGCTFVSVGCPEVEGNKRNLEAHTGDEEEHAEEGECIGFAQEREDSIKIQGASASINQRETVEQQTS